jgi:hypothetical protein
MMIWLHATALAFEIPKLCTVYLTKPIYIVIIKHTMFSDQSYYLYYAVHALLHIVCPYTIASRQ